LRKIAISEITSGENVSHVSESFPAPAVPQWKFIHVLSAKNDSSVSSLSDDGAARGTLHRRSIDARGLNPEQLLNPLPPARTTVATAHRLLATRFYLRDRLARLGYIGLRGRPLGPQSLRLPERS
jgi:hypothetical protein